MKKSDFNKEIKVTTLTNDNILAMELKSILYTPNKYRIPVAFVDTSNSADDTDKYIMENYTKDEQEKLKYNEAIDNEFLSKIKNLNSENEIIQLANEYKKKLLDVDYIPPSELRCINTNDDINNLKGYFVIDENAIIDINGQSLTEFLNLDLNKFNDYLVFFTKYFGMFIDFFEDIDFINIQIDQLTNISEIISLAQYTYASKKNSIISVQDLFKKFVDLLYGYNNSKRINSLTLKQKFYIFYEENKKSLSEFSDKYKHNGLFNFNYTSSDLKNLKHKNTNELINKIKKLDPKGNKISSSYSIITDNIYTVFYISLYYLVLSNHTMIKKCKNCHRYFLTTKSNTFYCDNIYYENKTCKDIGNQLSQKRKENEEPVYGKYRQIYAKKAMAVKRHPDIPEYKENYKNWKPLALKYLQEYKCSTLDAKTFEKWLKYTSDEKIKSKLKTIDEFKD